MQRGLVGSEMCIRDRYMGYQRPGTSEILPTIFPVPERRTVVDPFSTLNIPELSSFDHFHSERNADDEFHREADSVFPSFRNNYESNFHPQLNIAIPHLTSIQTFSFSKPVSVSTMKELPVFSIEEKHCKKNSKGETDFPSCAICYSEMIFGESAILIPCGHMFHQECIKPWFEGHNTCPICRFELPTERERSSARFRFSPTNSRTRRRRPTSIRTRSPYNTRSSDPVPRPSRSRARTIRKPHE
eukprot:TRINITY_DN67592_c0_g1_i1.p1 TRINITY_DN67592_c0_g1~~TRINITY_DN67592_c0_g1_i1.p1  ORF type:complete len:244 (+),score=12.86 TRINITY_DN67592_c0_g1_i1:157-888(+)